MADVMIEASVDGDQEGIAIRGGPFWTSPTVGYVIYVGSDGDLVYNKTVNGGANWGGAVHIRVGDIVSYDCMADWQIPGDAGTKIHITYTDGDSDDVRYVYLDTSDDSVGGDVQIEACLGTGVIRSPSRRYQGSSITKTRGGNLAIAVKYTDSDYGSFFSFYTSSDASTWNSKTSPWEGSFSDYTLLFPGNEADNQDVWATFWDGSENEILLKTYDDSGNSWSEQSISITMYEASNFLNMDGQIRLSDGHLIFAAWNYYDYSLADLMTWDINGAGSITAKADVLTNSAESFFTSVFINQDTDDIYIAYIKGTAVGSLVKVFYQKSTNGGGAWGGQLAMQADAEDNEQWLSAGAMKAAWGGKFQPFWKNDDFQDLFTNTDNGISIAAAVGGVNYPISLSPGLTASATVAYLIAYDRGMSPGLTISATVLKGWGRAIATTADLTISTTILKGWGRTITTTADLAISATVAYLVAYKRAVTADLTAAVSVLKGWGRTITTSPGLTISTTILKGWGRTIATAPGLTVSVTILKGWGRTITTSPGLTVAVTVLKSWGRTITTSPGLTASATVAYLVAYKRVVSAGLTISTTIVATLSGITNYLITIVSNLTVSATVDRTVAYKRAVSTGLTAAVTIQKSWGRKITIVANLAVSVALSILHIVGIYRGSHAKLPLWVSGPPKDIIFTDVEEEITFG